MGGIAIQPTQAAAQPQPQPIQTPPVNTNVTGLSTGFQDFIKKSDQEQAQIINSLNMNMIPSMFDKTGIQALGFALGGIGTPQVVDDSTLDGMNGRELFRTINGYKNTALGTKYTSSEIASQILYSDYAVYNGTGGQSFGKGLYHADSFRGSVGYGGVTDATTIRGKLIGKVISDTTLTSKFRNDTSAMASAIKSKFGRGDDGEALYALAKGYTAVSHGSYYTVVNRAGMVYSSRIKDVSSRNHRSSW